MATDTPTIDRSVAERIVDRLLAERYEAGQPTSMPADVHALLRSAAAELDALTKTLVTAHHLVAHDASDRPGISNAIRPFLAAAVEDLGLLPSPTRDAVVAGAEPAR